MATADVDRDERIDDELTCPVPSCPRSFNSVPSLMGHVGHHDGGWERAARTPREIKQIATAHDFEASKTVARVKYYLHRHDVSEDAVTVYYDHSYGNVQIEAGDVDDWHAFKRATQPDGIRYVGGRRSYCTDAFVEDLPDVPAEGECDYPGCDRDGPRTVPIFKDGEAAVLCPPHRKEFLGVSS